MSVESREAMSALFFLSLSPSNRGTSRAADRDISLNQLIYQPKKLSTMKKVSMIFAAAMAVVATSCGGSGKSSASEDYSEEKKVNVAESDIKFSGDLKDCIELVPGEYTMTLDQSWGWKISIPVEVKVIGQTDLRVDDSTSAKLIDAQGTKLSDLTVYSNGDINTLLSNGDIDATAEFVFVCYLDTEEEAKEMAEKATGVKAYISKGYEYTPSSSSSDSSSDYDSSSDSNLSKTLSKNGVTYECVHDPVDNDRFLNKYSISDILADKELIIQAWEIWEEETLRYMMAEGDTGMDKPEAYARSNKFDKLYEDYDENSPVGIIRNNLYSLESAGFTSEQASRIKAFDKKCSDASSALRNAK